MQGWFTLAGLFIVYGAISVVGTLYLYACMPETENKTLQEIEQFFVGDLDGYNGRDDRADLNVWLVRNCTDRWTKKKKKNDIPKKYYLFYIFIRQTHTRKFDCLFIKFMYLMYLFIIYCPVSDTS